MHTISYTAYYKHSVLHTEKNVTTDFSHYTYDRFLSILGSYNREGIDTQG